MRKALACGPADETDDAKALRLLAALRWLIASPSNCTGLHIGDQPFMLMITGPKFDSPPPLDPGNYLAKHLAEPAGGVDVLAEDPQAKADRILAVFRLCASSDENVARFLLDAVPFVMVRYRPEPDGPHNPDADMSGIHI